MLDPTTTYALFEASLAGSGYLGFGRPLLASGLASGLFQYASAGLVATSFDVGTAGTGKGTGLGVVLGVPVLVPAMTASFAGMGLLGAFAPSLAAGVSEALSAALAGALLTGVHVGTGAGTGALRLAPTGAGTAVFAASLRASGLAGSQVDRLAAAVALGLDSSLPSASGALAIAGPSSVYPGGGVGLVKIT